MFIRKTNLSEELTKKHQLTMDWHSQSAAKVNTFASFLRVHAQKNIYKKRPPWILSTFISVMTWMVGNIGRKTEEKSAFEASCSAWPW